MIFDKIKSFGKKRIILGSVIVVLLAALIFGNVMAASYWGFLVVKFGNDRTDFESEKVSNVLAAGDELVQEIAEDSITLIKNEGVLPLKKDQRKVNLFGYASTEKGFILSGGGSGTTALTQENDRFKVSLPDAFEAEGFEYNKKLEEVYTDFSSRDMNKLGRSPFLCEPKADVYTGDVIRQAKDFSDIAVVTFNRFASESTELPLYQPKEKYPTDATRGYLELTTEEEDMLDIVSDNFGTVIVLLNTGSPIEMQYFENDGIDAVMYVGFLGQSGALAIPRLLKGYKEIENEDGTKEEKQISPSGKLSDTYVYKLREYNPTDANMFPNPPNYDARGEIAYVENIYVGYKWYETADREGYFRAVDNGYGKGYDGVVKYPFGRGLSYTDFSWNVEKISVPNEADLTADSQISIDVMVTNTGSVAGKDVVQLYSTPTYHKGEIEKAFVNLVAFAKTENLAPDQSQVVTLELSAYDLACYDAYDKNNNSNSGYELDRGDYELKLMTDAHTGKDCESNVITYHVPTTINIKKDPVTEKDVVNRFTGPRAYMGLPMDGSNAGGEPIEYLSRADFAGTFPTKRPADRSDKEFIKQVNTAYNDRYDTTEMPTTGVEHDLRLVTKADGSFATYDELKNAGTALKYNEELCMELGTDYDSPKWKELLDQMTAPEMALLVEQGGFKTEAAASVGKPIRKDLDGPHGFHDGDPEASLKGKWTAFPIEALIGCSWNPQIAYNMGQAQGVLGNATNVSGWYGPGLNLHRNAYSGRYFEYYSEDSLITGTLGGETVRGAKNRGLISYMKHFAMSEEGVNPDNVKSWNTEQAFRETYLRPFEIAVKGGGATGFMTAFNCIGAVWAGACDALNNDILRDEWGFRGALLSDWSGGREWYMIAEQAVRGGNDFMLSPYGGSKLDQKNPTSMSLARTASKNILYSFVNTYATAKKFQENGDPDDRYNVDLIIDVANSLDATVPILMVVGLNVILAGGMAVCVIFIVKKPKNKKTA